MHPAVRALPITPESFFSPWVSGGARARVTARVPLASGLSRALRSLVPGSQRSPPRSVKCWQKGWDVWGLATNTDATQSCYFLESMCPALSPSLDAGLGPRSLPGSHLHLPPTVTVSLGGLHRTLGLPHSSRLAFPPHSALVAFSLDSLRRRPHLPTPFLFLAASELDPSKIINGSAETVAGRLQPSLFPGSRLCSPLFIPPHPVFLEAFIRRL